MDNFKFQIQSLKSQIDNIKLQLSNIEMQYNNIFGSNSSEQLLNLSIQILNTGVQAFNTGKNEAMIVSDNYYAQLKNISSLINTILDQQKINPMIQQQMLQQQMMQQQMLQQQMMQQQMMQQQMLQQQMLEKEMMKQQEMIQQQQLNEQMNEVLNMDKKIHLIVTFASRAMDNKYNFSFYKGTRIRDALDKISEKLGVPKNNLSFSFNGKELERDDSRKIEEKLYDGALITVFEYF